MITVGAFEAKTKFSELLDRVERGEEVVITRHGKEVARLSKAPSSTKGENLKAEFARFRERMHKEGVSFTADEIKSYRDEGRY